MKFKDNLKIFYRAFLSALTALLCPIILIFGIVSADANTKKIGYNINTEIISENADGSFTVMNKTLDKKYLSWTKYPAIFLKTALPDYIMRLFYYTSTVSDVVIQNLP